MKRLQISISSSRVGSSSPMMRGSLPRPEPPVRRARQREREFFSFPFFFLFFSLFLSSRDARARPGPADRKGSRATRKSWARLGEAELSERGLGGREEEKRKRGTSLPVPLEPPRPSLICRAASSTPLQTLPKQPRIANLPVAVAQTRSFFIECLGACTFHTRHL